MALTLVLIDLQQDFFAHPELAAARSRLVAAVNELSHAFRQAGRPVVWVRQELRADLTDLPLDLKRRGVAITVAGTPGVELLPDLIQSPSDHRITKTRYSAFYETPLRALLTALGTTKLVVGGVNTHACVRTTIVDAYQQDLPVTVAVECLASTDPEHHTVTLRYLDQHVAPLAVNTALIRELHGA